MQKVINVSLVLQLMQKALNLTLVLIEPSVYIGMFGMLVLQLLGILTVNYQIMLHGLITILLCAQGWKWFLVIRRPEGSSKRDPGMPSAHAIFYAFMATYFGEPSLYILTCFVGASRVIRGDHSINDVIVGTVIGGWAGYEWGYYGPKESLTPMLCWTPIIFLLACIFNMIFPTFSGYQFRRFEEASRWLCPSGWFLSYMFHVVLALSQSSVSYYPTWVLGWNIAWDWCEVYMSRFHRTSRWGEGAKIWALGDLISLPACLWVNPESWKIALFIILVHVYLHRYIYNDQQLRIATWIQTLSICFFDFISPVPIALFDGPTQRVIILAALFRFLANVGLIKASWERRRKNPLVALLCLITMSMEASCVLQYLYLSSIPIRVNVALTGILLAGVTLYDTGVKEEPEPTLNSLRRG